MMGSGFGVDDGSITTIGGGNVEPVVMGRPGIAGAGTEGVAGCGNGSAPPA